MKTKGILKQRNVLYCCVFALVFCLSCEKEYVVEEGSGSDVMSLEYEYSGLKTGSLTDEMNVNMLYGPTRFTIEKNNSKKEVVNLVIDNFNCVEGPYRLYVRNGDENGKKRVSSISIKLDGKRVLGLSNFSKKINYYMLEVPLKENSVLEVKIDGQRKRTVELFITGKEISFSRCYDKKYADGSKIIQLNDGGYVIVGYDSMLKIDKTGNIEWEKDVELSNICRRLLKNADGGFVVAGYSRSNIAPGYHAAWDYYVAKYDEYGELEWERCYGGNSYEDLDFIIESSQGGYILAGNTDSNDGDISTSLGGKDVWIVKIDDNGDIEWEKSFGGYSSDYIGSIMQVKNGEYVVTVGEYGSTDWVIRFNDSGDLIWKKDFYSNVYVYSLIEIDNYFIAYGELDDKYYIVKVDENEDFIINFMYTIGNVFYHLHNVKKTSDNGLVISGNIIDEDYRTNYGVMKYGENMDLEWVCNLGGSQEDVVQDITETIDGGYAIVGYTFSRDGDVKGNVGTGIKCWVVKIDKNGDLNIP